MKKRNSPYYEYMAPYFEKGTAAEIVLAKKEYRKQYKTSWRKENRKENKAIAVSWTKEELHILADAAKRHHQKPTRFIKQATLGYINKRYVVPSQQEINKILQLVAMTYNTIESIAQESEINTTSIKKMQEELFQLEHEMRVAILSPKTIEQIIVQEIQKHPDTKEHLIRLLETIKDDY